MDVVVIVVIMDVVVAATDAAAISVAAVITTVDVAIITAAAAIMAAAISGVQPRDGRLSVKASAADTGKATATVPATAGDCVTVPGATSTDFPAQEQRAGQSLQTAAADVAATTNY